MASREKNDDILLFNTGLINTLWATDPISATRLVNRFDAGTLWATDPISATRLVNRFDAGTLWATDPISATRLVNRFDAGTLWATDPISATGAITNSWSKINTFYNTYARVEKLGVTDFIGYHNLPTSFANNCISYDPLDNHHSEDYFSPASYKDKAKRLQKLIKGTLLQMIEKIMDSVFREELLNLRAKIYRLMSISKKIFGFMFMENVVDSKKLLLFEPQSNEKTKIAQQVFLYNIYTKTITNSKIFNAIVA